jgi:ABC-type sugar transport system permease subunit
MAYRPCYRYLLHCSNGHMEEHRILHSALSGRAAECAARALRGRSIDGATRPQQFWKITLPLLRPITLLVVMLSTIGGFSLFIEPFVMTGGGPAESTLSVVLYLYKNAFQFLRMGYAATIGFALALMIFLVTLIQRKLLDVEQPY